MKNIPLWFQKLIVGEAAYVGVGGIRKISIPSSAQFYYEPKTSLKN